MATYTLTFCESGENHKGMQVIGKMADTGFTLDELDAIVAKYPQNAEFLDLGRQYGAGVVVLRNGLNILLGQEDGADLLYHEHTALKPIWDTKAFMKGRVVDKHARHNLVVADFDQAPNYEQGMGTILNYARLPVTQIVRQRLPWIFGEKATNLIAEANYYYDVNKCYIGFHGDTERRRVIGIRLGASIPLWYQWYQHSKPVSDLYSTVLNHGDMYVMSEKAVGVDWMKKTIPTLRHAAGRKETLEKLKLFKSKE